MLVRNQAIDPKRRLTRRSVLAGGAVLIVTSGSTSAAEDEKTRFMNDAVRNIREEAAKASPSFPQPMQLSKVCVPYPFADFDFYYTKGILSWTPNPGQALGEVVVPEGFCTDLTSVPRAFWSAYPKTGRYAYAAIAHDYLYWVQPCSRLEADDVLFAAMEDASVSSATKWLIYSLVRAGGQSSWSANAKAKSDGEKRFLKVFPQADQLVSWTDWKKDPAHFSD